MKILGISCFYHDAAACLVDDGIIVAAAQEERFTRKKHDSDFPTNAIRYCLAEAEVSGERLDAVAFYDKPILTFNRLLETYLSFAPSGLRSFVASIPVWVKQKVLQKELILRSLNDLGRGELDRERLLFGLHHHSHAASAFYPSPFEEAAILVMDGVGEWATTTVGMGSDEKVLDLLKDISERVSSDLDVHVTRMVVDPETVRISGETDTFNTVDTLKNGLEASDYYREVTISAANLDRSGKKVLFELKLQRAR